jgi:hypothetical protein
MGEGKIMDREERKARTWKDSGRIKNPRSRLAQGRGVIFYSLKGSYPLWSLLDESITTCQLSGIKIERPEIEDILSKRFCMIHDGRGLIHAAACFLGMNVFSEPAFVAIMLFFHGGLLSIEVITCTLVKYLATNSWDIKIYQNICQDKNSIYFISI